MYETQQNIGLLLHLYICLQCVGSFNRPAWDAILTMHLGNLQALGDERMHPSAAGLKRLKV